MQDTYVCMYEGTQYARINIILVKYEILCYTGVNIQSLVSLYEKECHVVKNERWKSHWFRFKFHVAGKHNFVCKNRQT